jgi:hypothetical protein
MASRHLKQNRGQSRVTLFVVAASFVVAFAAITAAVAVFVIDGSPTPAHASAHAVSDVQQSVSQEGKLVAVSPTSVTALSVDGFARTYVINSETNAITKHGSLIGGAGTTFEVNDEVSIVGVVRDGTAVATAVADKQVSDLNGPPMDGV